MPSNNRLTLVGVWKRRTHCRVMRRSFSGHIAGFGTTSGTRLVVGAWNRSPFGAFCDVMVEHPDGRRILIAPRADIAQFVASTYSFDEVRIEPVSVRSDAEWSIHTRSLQARITPGRRHWVSAPLAVVPSMVRRTPWWAKACNPVAGLIMPGVQTFGTAGGGRHEWYAATEVRHLTQASATWESDDLGGLAAVTPPVRFGFASSPASPTLTTLTSYVQEA